MKRSKVWIVTPAHDEESKIGQVLDALRAEGWHNFIVVNDGSRDRTAKIAKSMGAIVIEHERNLGLGAALRTGLNRARELGADCAITFDADGQHDPEAVRAMVEGLEDADLVIGLRKHLGMSLHKRVGNFVLNLITCMFCGVLTDSQSGMRAFSRRALESIKIKSDRYEVSSEIIIQAKKRKLRLRWVPVRCFYNEYSKARGTTIASGIKILLKLLKLKASGDLRCDE